MLVILRNLYSRRLSCFDKRAFCSRFACIDLHHVTVDEFNSPCDLSPVLIVHGLFGHAGNWNSISKALNRQLRRRVVLADLRNHGDSPHVDEMSYEVLAADVEHLIRKISQQTGKCILLGHSLGGKVACELALNKSHLIEKLIIEDIVPRSAVPSQKTDMSPLLDALLKVECPQTTLYDARRQVDKHLQDLGVLAVDVRQFLLTNLTLRNGSIQWKMNLRALQNFIYDAHGFSKESLKKTFHPPSLFVFGRDSPYYRGHEDDVFIKSMFSNVKITVIEKCGHWLHAEKPKEFINIVVDFIRQGL